MNKLLAILPILVAVALLHSGIEKKGSFDITDHGDQSVSLSSTPELQKKGSFDLMLVGGQDPELPVSS
ncbi:MAG: hypothetical protein K8J31_22415 [Anaerolineae bacterium]|nr:hypothetical protein [Anaerolineae bacterium]